MTNLLSKLSKPSKPKVTNPREIFMTLPDKDKKYDYPRDVQSDVWEKWYEQRTIKNNIIKMNTGSGKTVVALTILQSCLNEGIGPAIYVVPDKYLCSQVCKEAKALGIEVTMDENDYSYTENKAILVITIHKLINGKSIFGMRSSNNYPIGSVLLDDVHACLDTLMTQFSVKIPREQMCADKKSLYEKIVEIFDESWIRYNKDSYTDIVEMKNPTKRFLIPFWIWEKEIDNIYRAISEYDNENNDYIFFKFPLIKDVLKFCNCIVTEGYIEIMPKGISITKITSFEEAKRRIFLSATLADDSVFSSIIGLKENEINNIITPTNANDIGDRLILFPKHLNSALSDDEIKEKVIEISEKYNVVVIVPSFSRAKFWDDTEEKICKKDDIHRHIKALKEGHVGLRILVNRYDGIDLPDDACRMLVIDGLPPLRTEYEKYVQSINPNMKIVLQEQIQRIEQGMGRGVRSNNDSCCIVLMGNQLADILLRNNGVDYFSKATKAQYLLSKELWELLKNEYATPSVSEIFELADYSLKRKKEWIQRSKEELSDVQYESSPNINELSISLRKAFEFAEIENFTEAIDELDALINKIDENKTKGYLMQIKAEYMHFIDASQAQQILKSARKFNSGVTRSLGGITYDKLIYDGEQEKSIIKYMKGIGDNFNNRIIHVDAILDELKFSSDAKAFEKNLKELGKILGFSSSMPDEETNGEGPDNLWMISDKKYLVIECKSGATTNTISKEYCNQLGGSVRWFNNIYDNNFNCIPIMIHPSIQVDSKATPVEKMRVINDTRLNKLKKQIQNMVREINQIDNWDKVDKVHNILKVNKLRYTDFIEEYTSSPR